MRNIYLSFFLFFLLVINIRAEEVILEIESQILKFGKESPRLTDSWTEETKILKKKTKI